MGVSMSLSIRTDWNASISPYVPFATYYTEEIVDPKTRKTREVGLKHMRGYDIAKNGGKGYTKKDQIACAQDVIDEVLYKNGKETPFFTRVKNEIKKYPDTIIIAPSLQTDAPHNVLPITFAHILAEETDCKVDQSIYQKPKDKSKRQMDGLERLAKDTEFYGAVKPGQTYYIVDDVMTMGGTVAAMKSYIESKGGKVVGIAVLADGTKELHRRADINVGIPLAPTQATMEKLEQTFKDTNRLHNIFKGSTGHGHKELTEREAAFVQSKYHGDFIKLRNGLLGATNTGHPQGSPAAPKGLSS